MGSPPAHPTVRGSRACRAKFRTGPRGYWRSVVRKPNPRPWSTPGIISAIQECEMPKNKGGREVRKPKQAKKPKAAEAPTLMAKVNGPKKAK